MNYKLMLRMLGRTLQVEALLLLLPLLVSLGYGEDPRPFLYTILPVAVLGTGLARLKSKSEFFSHEGFTVVGLIWVVQSLCGAFPFWFSGWFDGYVDCLFETVSGFTTSGATILTDIEALPRGILFWRSFTSWIGGMGFLLFTLAFLPKVGPGTRSSSGRSCPGRWTPSWCPRPSSPPRFCILSISPSPARRSWPCASPAFPGTTAW